MGSYLLVTGDFVKVGGMDRANHALAEYLADRGDDLRLVAHRVADDLRGRPNVSWVRVPKPLNSYLLGNPLMHRVGRAEARRAAARGARVVVNGGNCLWGDVNWVHHVHAADAPNPAGSPLTRLRRRLTYRLHRAEERAAVPRARAVIATCDRTRRDVVGRLGVAEDRVHVVLLGIDAGKFRPAEGDERAAIRAGLGWPEGRPKVAFVGALGDRRKGFDTLFAAWRALCADPGWDADLVVVGRGAEVPAWRARTAEAGLSGRIAFLGFVRDLPDLYRACDAHCLPSRYEGFSLVTQEALACGAPAFVSRAAGIADLYPEGLQHLLIPDPEDGRDLADRLRAWRGRMAEYREAVRPFSARIREHTWERMSSKMVEVIESGPPGAAR